MNPTVFWAEWGNSLGASMNPRRFADEPAAARR
jgi:hypothetical protein